MFKQTSLKSASSGATHGLTSAVGPPLRKCSPCVREMRLSSSRFLRNAGVRTSILEHLEHELDDVSLYKIQQVPARSPTGHHVLWWDGCSAGVTQTGWCLCSLDDPPILHPFIHHLSIICPSSIHLLVQFSDNCGLNLRGQNHPDP